MSLKLALLLKWRSTWNIETAIQVTVEWYREFYENNETLTHLQLTKYISDAKTNKASWVA